MKLDCLLIRVVGAVVVAIIGCLPFSLHAESKLYTQTGISGGIVVALDFSDGKSIAALAADGNYVVHGLVPTQAAVDKVRNEIKATGLYGKVSCDIYNGQDLPYIDGLVNLVLRRASSQVPLPELMRVIAPGGLLMEEGSDGWTRTVKPRPDGMDEWNQFLHSADNNGVSLDNVGPPQRLRWHDTPEYGRSKALSPSFTNMVSADGLLFTIEDEATTEDVNAPTRYILVARDGFNGVELWRRPMPMEEWGGWQTQSIKNISTQQQRCLAAIGKTVYFCSGFGSPVTALEARTGAEKQVYQDTEATTEIIVEGNVLYGIKGKPFKLKGGGSAVGSVELYAIDLGKGTMLWSKPIANEYTGGTLAAKGRYLVYNCKDGLGCLDSATGKALWMETILPGPQGPLIDEGPDPREAPVASKKKNKNKKKTKAPTDYSVFSANTQPTIVLTDDMVFCAIGDSITAKSLVDGKTLWTETGGTIYRKSSDLFIANGLVWSRNMQGRDIQTGAVVRSLTQEMTGPMAHDRCYRNRITHRYYLNSASGGTDFMGLDGNGESPNPWARSTCGLAVMPANGMIYNGPYVCQCAIGAMITGVNGLYNGSGNTYKRFTVDVEPRVVQGPAFGETVGAVATAEDWPTYRYSSMRSAVTDATTPEALAPQWKVNLGSQPTAPVVIGESVYVANRDGHTLYALDRESGKTRWTFIADGRIDSPPTYYKGLVLFGSRGGWVYGLRASDGQLVWKFNGMPERRLVCDTGQLESAWPVNGSVMIFQDTAYFAAGRSSFLDGGIGVFGLDPLSGTMKHGRMIQGPFEDDSRDFPIQADGTFQLDGFKSDIFSCNGSELFVRNEGFTPELEPINPDDVTTSHLMASSGFLNDSPQHRTYWTVDRNLRYGGGSGTFGSGPAGDVTAFDGKHFFEVRGYAPGRNLEGRGKGMSPLDIYSVYSGSLLDPDKDMGQSSIPAIGSWEEQWNTPTPFAGHAIAASQNTLLAAGVPMLEGYSQAETDASYAGKKGGIAWLLNAKDGKKLQELRFDAAPIWDGIAIAHNRYFISLKDGSVLCFSGKSGN